MNRIAAAACPDEEPLVVEIGAGRGALTRSLLARAERVVAVEVDPYLAEHLRSKFEGDPKLTVAEGDILETDLTQWGQAVVAGNLPYYITSPILEKILRAGEAVKRAVLLVQMEVARRITAHPGSRDFGYLSVQTQFYAVPELLFRVPPAAFHPPPKVDSAVIRLTPRTAEQRWAVSDEKKFLRFAGQCFRQKRKTIRNNLAGIYSREKLDAFPQAPLRAEQMSMEQFIELWRALEGG